MLCVFADLPCNSANKQHTLLVLSPFLNIAPSLLFDCTLITDHRNYFCLINHSFLTTHVCTFFVPHFSCWFILKDSTLYRYNAPIDDMTENVVQLPGYTVTRSQEEPHTQFILNLEHQVHLFIYETAVGDITPSVFSTCLQN